MFKIFSWWMRTKGDERSDDVATTNNIITTKMKTKKAKPKKSNKTNMCWMALTLFLLFYTIEKIKTSNVFVFLKICMFFKHAGRRGFTKRRRKFLWISANISEFNKKIIYTFFQIPTVWRKLTCVFSLSFKVQKRAALHIKNWWCKNPALKTHRCYEWKQWSHFFCLLFIEGTQKWVLFVIRCLTQRQHHFWLASPLLAEDVKRKSAIDC